ncbi:hypothetical protein QJS04_geneDACA014532 [Acorus gramineus]|uniref:DNA/RNA-binding protein Alba-like domain-containing protein n=1 Tax=Acorus gramineus TaxID=55184 RepID=A0AAV9APW7_ACOGR|nr:hypothetical protein QJS04_geneDACA014532 [Acorus gramineus]
MEEVTEGINNLQLSEPHKKNKIQVSNTKKPLFFYVNLAKRYMQQHNEVELSALGMGIVSFLLCLSLTLCSTCPRCRGACTMQSMISEILKNNGLAVEKKIMTSTIDMKDESRGRPIQKAKVTGIH